MPEPPSSAPSHGTRTTSPRYVLVVDDDSSTVMVLNRLLSSFGWEVLCAGNLSEANSHLASVLPDLAIVDVYLERDDGLQFTRELRERNPETGIVVISREDTEELAKKALASGADSFLSKPIGTESLRLTTERLHELRAQRHRASQLESDLKQSVMDTLFPGIVTHCDAMRAVLRLVEKVGPRDLSVLVCGESGTGKEQIARAIHHLSGRAKREFVELNCAALPPNLVESELFGHERGAFTGAVVSRAGKIEQANNGTLFLDEIGEMPVEIQPKLLRALQEKRFSRVGGKGVIESDFRLVCATNRDLVQEVKAGRFREDLFYRVSVFPIKLPPLRDRREDLDLLIGHFLGQENASGMKVTREARAILHGYGWPGNIRELKNFVQAVTLLTDSGLLDEAVVLNYFGTRLELGSSLQAERASGLPRPVRRLEDIEREEILHALRIHEGNVPEAARALGMGRATLYKYLKKTGLAPDAPVETRAVEGPAGSG